MIDLYGNIQLSRGPDIVVGHYTQMVWADTSEIGCAVTYYTTNSSDATWHHFLLVCNYGPGGNYLGLPLYEVGEACSNCPNGLNSNEKYEALCGETDQPAEEISEELEREELLQENDI